MVVLVESGSTDHTAELGSTSNISPNFRGNVSVETLLVLIFQKVKARPLCMIGLKPHYVKAMDLYRLSQTEPNGSRMESGFVVCRAPAAQKNGPRRDF